MIFPARKPFNLAELTAFNPALVYGFDAESSIRELNVTDRCVHNLGQYRDMNDAYRHMQDELLPFLMSNGRDALTPELFLNWLNQLHQRIARTLANDHSNPDFAGSFVTKRVVRWHLGVDSSPLIGGFITARTTSERNSYQTLFLHKARENQMRDEDTLAFLGLLIDVSKANVPLAPDMTPFIDASSSVRNGMLLLAKLAYLVDNNEFEPRKSELLNKYLSLCMAPAKIPAAIQAFSKSIVAEWRRCDSSLDQVAETAFNLFIGLTTIHPYFNGNGRVATAMVNLFITSMGYPSILLRTPSERDDLNSSYSRAIKLINEQPNLLKEHIKRRINETKAGNVFKDPELEKTIVARVKHACTAELIIEEFPEFDIEGFYQFNIAKLMLNNHSPDIQLRALGYVAEQMELAYRELVAKREKNKAVTAVASVARRQIDKEGIARIEATLAEITKTNTSNWKSFDAAEGLITLLTLTPNEEDKKKAKALAHLLNETGAVTAACMREKSQEANYVVKATNVNEVKLREYKILEVETSLETQPTGTKLT